MDSFVIVIAVLAGVFTLYMGFVDGASAVASCIATHAMKQKYAILMASLSMLVAPLVMCLLIKSDSVARTVGSLIDTVCYTSLDDKTGFIFLLSAMLAAGIWAIISTLLVVPNSASHTLLGGLVGAGIVVFGGQSIDWNSVGIKVVLMVFLAPILGLIVGYSLQKLFYISFRGFPRKTKYGFRIMQRLNIILLSAAIAINNVQKSMGIYLIAMVIFKNQQFDAYQFSWWIVLIYSLLQSLGLFFGGEKLINAVGNKIFRLSTVQSFVAQLSTIGIALASSFLGLPISTGQVVSSSIMGVGAADKISSVRWLQAKKIFLSWIITFPVSLGLGALICFVLKLVVGV